MIELVYSMTGYGKNIQASAHQTVTTEIKTTNHRFLDMKIHCSRSLLFLEDEIKEIIQSNLARGRIEVFIRIENESISPLDVQIDWGLMDQYMNQIQKVKERYHISDELPIEVVTAIPELLTVEHRNELLPGEKELIISSVQHACQEVQSGRQREGKNLQLDVLNRMQVISNIVLSLEDSQPTIIESYRERIIKRVDTYVGHSVTIDESRLHQEIALLVEKGDITEELTRLKSHLTYSIELMDQDEPVGRKLDFIVQEIHRELNTIGSKAVDDQMSRTIVEAKSELEKIREQIQNIE